MGVTWYIFTFEVAKAKREGPPLSTVLSSGDPGIRFSYLKAFSEYFFCLHPNTFQIEVGFIACWQKKNI